MFGATRTQARAHLAASMEGLYKTPFEKFERWSPYGTPEDVAAFLRNYVDVGCVDLNLIAVAAHEGEAIEGVAEVRRLLRS